MLQQCMTRKYLFSQFLLWDHYMASLSHMQKTEIYWLHWLCVLLQGLNQHLLKGWNLLQISLNVADVHAAESAKKEESWMKLQTGRILTCSVYFSYHTFIYSSHTCSVIIACHYLGLLNDISCSHLSIYPSILDSLGLTLWYENLPL